jgi:hypothetical protein
LWFAWVAKSGICTPAAGGQNQTKKGATIFVDRMSMMNPALLQILLSAVAFCALIIAARTGLTPIEKKERFGPAWGNVGRSTEGFRPTVLNR